MTGDNKKNHRVLVKDFNQRTPQKTKKTIEIQKNPGSEPVGQSKIFANLPIPKGESAYAQAKNAEYKDRDLDSAEYYYKLAISKGDRVVSAIKDLASLMHQRGKTEEACKFLDKNRHLFRADKEKFENLYKTLEKQIANKGNSQNKHLKISGLSYEDTDFTVKNLFTNPIRIKSCDFGWEEFNGKRNFYCIVRFNSHSSARKTLESFHFWDRYNVQWVSVNGEIVCDAHYARQKMDEHRKNNPTFDYSLFERDPQGYVLCLPVDNLSLCLKRQCSEQENRAEQLLGTTLFTTIFSEKAYC
ncbi:hypothetical protein SteCoe_28389 [Stentor coeruleus]|uniref:RRM domain-containing protein n=1 Tax=Stentor coeruleus TaxID=5963 RepID=A0A1R2B8D1_9CILI|nr:hypothetical protein SteCoe_28389 [Stentor coeruleus]